MSLSVIVPRHTLPFLITSVLLNGATYTALNGRSIHIVHIIPKRNKKHIAGHGAFPSISCSPKLGSGGNNLAVTGPPIFNLGYVNLFVLPVA